MAGASSTLGGSPQAAPQGAAEEPPVTDRTGRDGSGEGLEYFGVRTGWQLVDLRELWRYRELLWIFGLRDLKVRYRQTLVGVAWAVVQPLTTTAIFLLLFGLLGRQPSSGEIPYALVVLSGLLPWQLFASTLTQATASLVAHQDLIGKVYFPRLILPLTAVIPPLVDFAVSLVLLAAMLAWYGVAPSWPVLLAPAFVAVAALTALAGGGWLSALNAMYRDVGYVVPFLLQIGFFVSPVVYATDALIPARWRPVFALNPMSGAVEGFRWSLLGKDAPQPGVVLAGLAALAVLLASGLAYFRRIERFLADRI